MLASYSHRRLSREYPRRQSRQPFPTPRQRGDVIVVGEPIPGYQSIIMAETPPSTVVSPPTVTTGAITIVMGSVPPLDDPVAAPTVIPGAVTIEMGSVASQTSVAPPTVVQPQTVVMEGVGPNTTVGEPTIVTTAQFIQAAGVGPNTTVGAPTVVRGDPSTGGGGTGTTPPLTPEDVRLQKLVLLMAQRFGSQGTYTHLGPVISTDTDALRAIRDSSVIEGVWIVQDKDRDGFRGETPASDRKTRFLIPARGLPLTPTPGDHFLLEEREWGVVEVQELKIRSAVLAYQVTTHLRAG